MNVFEVHRKIIADYEKYIRTFITISDAEIEKEVDHELKCGKLWPEPLLQFNPAFSIAGKVADLTRDKLVHKDVADIFKGYSLYHHQLEALRLGVNGKDFIVTSGTGSGKSLTYIGTVFSHLLNNTASKGVVAIVVYPLNALINSQTGEFNKYRNNYFDSTGKEFPITYGQYTGQEEQLKRIVMRENPPQILLTNYMMLELLLTRLQERSIRDAIYENLKYLVFDELHTYRGRQGADVAMLIRRIRAKCQHEVTCIGTSATMVSGGSLDDQRSQVADVASKLFGKTFESSQVIMEKLASSLTAESNSPAKAELSAAIRQGVIRHTDVVRSVIFSPDGSRIITGTINGETTVWDALHVIPNSMEAFLARYSSSYDPNPPLDMEYDLASEAWRSRRLRSYRKSTVTSANQNENWFAAAFHLPALMKEEPNESRWKEMWEQTQLKLKPASRESTPR